MIVLLRRCEEISLLLPFVVWWIPVELFISQTLTFGIMSVVGFDIGYQTCYVAIARQGGIEAITNEYSDRCTPTCVSMGERDRCMGASANNQLVSNIKNTIWGWKKLIGHKFSERVVQNEIPNFTYKVVEAKDGGIGIQVRYLEETQMFAPEQVTAMMLTKLKEIAEAYLKTKVVDCVISVPCYFSDGQRRAMLDSAHMVGLNVLRLMNDTAATALNYGIYKQDLPAPEEKPRHVVFVDMGHADLQLAVCAFNKGKLKVLATQHDTDLGGIEFDRFLASHFADEFHKRYRVDARSNPRAYLRLLSSCEKLKKLMSANTQEIPLNIECFMDDKDVTGKMNRATFEEMAASQLNRVGTAMRAVLQSSKLSKDDIYSVELVGGSSRIPAVKELVKKIFDREASTTLNADEAVARGCALQCAILSPNFRVRDFSIADAQPYPINLSWQGAMDNEGGCSDMEICQQYHSIPFSKMLTFYRKEPFTLTAKYVTTDRHITDPFIGSFRVDGVMPQANGESSKVKVKVRVNINGLFNVSGATITEKIDNPPTADEPEPMDVDSSEAKTQEAASTEASDKVEQTDVEEGSGDSPKESTPTNDVDTVEPANKDAADKNSTAEKKGKPEKKKQTVKTIDLPIVANVIRMSKDVVNLYMEQEGKMIMQDKMEKERADAKNAVEEYVYEMRDKLSGPLSQFMLESDRESFLRQLEDTENWLYEDGECEAKQVYTDRLAALKKVGQPVVKRFREWSERPQAFELLGQAVQQMFKVLDAFTDKDEKYDHIEMADMEKVKNATLEKHSWLEQNTGLCNQQPLYTDPVVLVSQINAQRESLWSTCNPIINKPKPKPQEEPPKDGMKPPANDGTSATNGPSADQPDDTTAKPEQKEPQLDSDDVKADMELD